MKKNEERWINSAIKNPGALRKQLKIADDKTIPMKKLKTAEKKGGKLAKRAHLAETLKHLAHKMAKR